MYRPWYVLHMRTQERARKRRTVPPVAAVQLVKVAQKTLTGAQRKAEQADAAVSAALLHAAIAGWSMRELSDATGLALSNVCRRINAAERNAA